MSKSYPSAQSSVAQVGLVLLFLTSLPVAAQAQTFNFGTPPSKAEIAAIDIDTMPDGRGLPPGRGTAATGKAIYARSCAACHGDDLQGNAAVGGDTLIGGRGSLGSRAPKKTIESYWPYATTVFDYVKRAMPFNAPGSLSNDEIYAVTAYILYRGNIIGQNDEMSAATLPRVAMPNRDGFIADPRPDVRNYR